jgi:isoleucyl-tRNA synthetase
VPIIVFYCEQCREPLTDRKILDGIVATVSPSTPPTSGTSARPPSCCPRHACAKCGGGEFSKENDILDVWFDSGSSHLAVLNERFGLPGPPICTWKAATSIAAGSTARCWWAPA